MTYYPTAPLVGRIEDGKPIQWFGGSEKAAMDHVRYVALKNKLRAEREREADRIAAGILGSIDGEGELTPEEKELQQLLYDAANDIRAISNIHAADMIPALLAVRENIADRQDYLHYWERHWKEYQQRSIPKHIPRVVRGERFGVDWEGDSLSGIGIRDKDTIIVTRTPDIEEGDLVCMVDRMEAEGYYSLGILRLPEGSEFELEYPSGESIPVYPSLAKFVGRAVEVQRQGKPIPLAIELRP